VPDGASPAGVRVAEGDAQDQGPELWQSVVPAAVARAARRELAGLAGVRTLLAEHPDLTLPDPHEDLPPVAKDSLESVVVVEVAPVLDAVVGALRAHATQVQHVGTVPVDARDDAAPSEGPDGVLGWYALSNDVLAALPSREFYTVTPESAGPPRRFTGNDQTGPVAWTQ
ncbi:hypothetical protein DLJ96_05990, partial [Actinotalea fermentans ATCC 43279 = JCM 9966 = DSM 3133]